MSDWGSRGWARRALRGCPRLLSMRAVRGLRSGEAAGWMSRRAQRWASSTCVMECGYYCGARWVCANLCGRYQAPGARGWAPGERPAGAGLLVGPARRVACVLESLIRRWLLAGPVLQTASTTVPQCRGSLPTRSRSRTNQAMWPKTVLCVCSPKGLGPSWSVRLLGSILAEEGLAT